MLKLLASYAYQRAQARRQPASSSARAWSASARSRSRRSCSPNVPAGLHPDHLRPRRGDAAQHHRAAGLFEGQVKAVIELASLPALQRDPPGLPRPADRDHRHRAQHDRREHADRGAAQAVAVAAPSELQSQQEELQQTNAGAGGEGHACWPSRTPKSSARTARSSRPRQALEEKAEQLALTSKYKSEFLANMSHELRTPLNSLLILSEQLCREPRGQPDRRSRSSSPRRSTPRAPTCSTLINDILDLSKIESGTVVVDVGELRLRRPAGLRRAHLPPRRRDQGARLRDRRCDPSLPRAMYTDAKRLQQVLKNLLSNAFKFTEHGQGHAARSSRADGGLEPGQRVAQPRRAGGRVLGRRHRHRHPAGQAADHLRGVPAGRRHAPAASTAAPAWACRSAARSPGCSAARSGSTSAPGEGSTFTLYLPQTLRRRRDRRSVRRRSPAPAPSPRGAPRADRAATPSAGRRRRPRPPAPSAASTRSPTTATHIQPGDRVLLIVEDDPRFARLLLDLAREQGFKALVTAPRRDRAARWPASYQPARDHARHPPARHRRLARARPPQARLRHPPHPGPRHLDRRGPRARPASWAPLGFLAKPVETQRGPRPALRQPPATFVEPPERELLVVEDDDGSRDEHRRAARRRRRRGHAPSRTGAEALAGSREKRASTAWCSTSSCPTTSWRPARASSGRCAAARPAGRRLHRAEAARPRQEEPSLERLAQVRPAQGRARPSACSTRRRCSCTGPLAALPDRAAADARAAPPDRHGARRQEGADRRRRHPQHLRSDQLLERHDMNDRSPPRTAATPSSCSQSSPDIDIVLMDIMMPEMDGYDTMRAHPPDARVPEPADHRADGQGDEGRPREVHRGRRLGLHRQAGRHRAACPLLRVWLVR